MNQYSIGSKVIEQIDAEYRTSPLIAGGVLVRVNGSFVTDDESKAVDYLVGIVKATMSQPLSRKLMWTIDLKTSPFLFNSDKVEIHYEIKVD